MGLLENIKTKIAEAKSDYLEKRETDKAIKAEVKEYEKEQYAHEKVKVEMEKADARAKAKAQGWRLPQGSPGKSGDTLGRVADTGNKLANALVGDTKKETKPIDIGKLI